MNGEDREFDLTKKYDVAALRSWVLNEPEQRRCERELILAALRYKNADFPNP